MSVYECRFTIGIGWSTSHKEPKVRHTLSASALISRVLLLLVVAAPLAAEELEPRRWSHVPINTNFVGGGYAYTEGDIKLDPVLRIESATHKRDTLALQYRRSFEMFDRSAQIMVAHSQHNAIWRGTLDGRTTQVQRVGAGDPIVQLSINLIGAPPLQGKDYLDYRVSLDSETVVGASLSVQLPLGEYKEDKLLNLGGNRYVTRARMGVTHTRGQWDVELTGAVWHYSDNDEFFGETRLEQELFGFVQSHVIYHVSNRQWLGASLGYGHGGETRVDGIDKDDSKKDVAWALSWGYTLAPRFGMKLSYFGHRTKEAEGMDTDSLVLAFSTFF